MKIISVGFDAGLSNLGIAVIGSDGEYIDSMVLHTEAEGGVWLKGAETHSKLKSVFTEWHSDYGNMMRIAVESPSFGSRFNSQNVAFSRGIICALASTYDIPVIDAAPSSVKKVVAGNGKATKKELRSAVYGYLDIGTPANMSFDETDAIAVALWHHITTVNPDMKPKKETIKQPQEKLELA